MEHGRGGGGVGKRVTLLYLVTIAACPLINYQTGSLSLAVKVGFLSRVSQNSPPLGGDNFYPSTAQWPVPSLPPFTKLCSSIVHTHLAIRDNDLKCCTTVDI